MLIRLLPLIVASAAFAGLWGAPRAAAQNQIMNGSFEDPAVPAEDADGQITFVAPAMLPGGWELISGSVDVMRRNGATQYQVPDGLQALDLTGNGSRGTIRRMLELDPFVVYRLSFAFAGNPTCEVGLKRINLTVENILFTQPTFNTTGWSVTNMGWTLYEYTFAGPIEPVAIQFSSLTNTQCGPMIDDVSLEECFALTSHPASAATCAGGSIVLSAGATGDGIKFRWRRGTTILTDGGAFSGTSTPNLTINPVNASTAGTYTCTVFNVCGELTTLPATVSVIPAPCPGDANGDNSANFADITSVLEHWGFNYLPGTGPGDATCDGVVNFADITRVLENWSMSCG